MESAFKCYRLTFLFNSGPWEGPYTSLSLSQSVPPLRRIALSPTRFYISSLAFFPPFSLSPFPGPPSWDGHGKIWRRKGFAGQYKLFFVVREIIFGREGLRERDIFKGLHVP